MILGIGLDLCQIERIGRAIEKPRFVERVFAPSERARIDAAAYGPRRAEIAAGLFAAKEAVAKALGTGFSGFGTADVEILRDAAGGPACALHRGAAERLMALAGEGGRVFVSITHDGGTAAAVAVVEGSGRRE